jgi:hypothetical protein
MSTISTASKCMAETAKLLERAFYVAFLAGALVAILCVVALMAVGTFAVLHKGNDFGGFGGGSGDIIVVPAQPF